MDVYEARLIVLWQRGNGRVVQSNIEECPTDLSKSELTQKKYESMRNSPGGEWENRWYCYKDI